MLRARGVTTGDPVGICAERSVELVIGLLATLKAGGAYVPLDPSHPPARLWSIVDELEPKLLLATAETAQLAGEVAGGVARLEIGSAIAGGEADENLSYDGDAESPAYVMYTSGSTGRPKGAINTHGGMINRLCWMQEAFQLSAADRVLQKTPYSFDVSVWEFFWALMTGARLVLARPDGHLDNAYLVELIRAAGITTSHFVPPMLQAFLAEPAAAECRSLRRVICSGQELPAALQQRFFEVLPGAELHNLYGPTEAAIDVTWHRCTADDMRSDRSNRQADRKHLDLHPRRAAHADADRCPGPLAHRRRAGCARIFRAPRVDCGSVRSRPLRSARRDDVPHG